MTAIYRALIAEASQPGTPRKGSINVEVKDNCLKISVTSDDLGDLRAIVNSYLYLVHASYSVVRSLSPGGHERPWTSRASTPHQKDIKGHIK
ncbi:KEOPS complex subunit Pcc1 [Acidilobus saccharovorans]|uniref:KEOPS complex subunit Pcc1 n=1 Tax=Acidilobus saccharovorans TaxID=242703 RepID=UPI003B836642